MSYLLQLAERDLGEARDNLARARHAATRTDPTQQWGQSGRTLTEIIACYEKWESEAMDAVKAAKAGHVGLWERGE